MPLNQYFRPLTLDKLVETSREYKENGYRLGQLCPKLERDDSITLIYSFGKGADLVNFEIKGIQKNVTEVPSVTELFIAAFVFENEAHDLFGVNIVGNLIDFQGTFYAFADGVEAPMTIVSPAQLAAREKAAKLAAAKAARAAKAKEQKAAAAAPSDAELEAKLAGMDPEKAAKVRAAMKAKAAKAAKAAAEAKSNELEDKLAGMDPEKAAKVRAAMEAKAKRQAEASAKKGE